MADKLSLDYETRSKVNLLNVGLHQYARHPSTRVLMAGWKINDHKTQLWQPHINPMPPAELREAMRDPEVRKCAWNAPFEEAITEHVLKFKAVKWEDTMIRALYASLPGKLELAGPAVGLPEEMCKMPEGKRLIRKFCEPRGPKQRKKDPREFNDWTSDPEDWELFGGYCVRDVDVEDAVGLKLANVPPPQEEWDLWKLDQEINRNGMPVDIEFVERAIDMGDREKQRLVALLMRETGLDKPMTQAVFLEWARRYGYPFNNLKAKTIQRAISMGTLHPNLVRMLRFRTFAGKTSLSKYVSIKEKTIEGRIYNMLQFYGAQRTGRWGGRDPQPHNLPRPDDAVEGIEAEVTELIRQDDYDELLMQFGNAMTPISSVVRSSFRAPEGYTFYCADLNAIENRVLGWLADCKAILDVFREGKCPYISFATYLYNQSYDELWDEYKNKKIKFKRTNAKPAVLGCGYMLGGGDEMEDSKGDIIKTGLWGYAESMGINITREESAQSVKVFRDAFPEVKQLWYRLKEAAMEAIRYSTTVRVGPVVFNATKGLMRVRLPSGRCLFYLRPRIEEKLREFVNEEVVLMPDGTKKVIYTRKKKRVEVITYEGVDQKTKRWSRQSTHPGKITENLVQAIARDVLCEGLKAAKAKGFKIVLHVHDEIVCEVPLDSHLKIEDLEECMSRTLAWAPDLPLAAAGEVTPFYKK